MRPQVGHTLVSIALLLSPSFARSDCWRLTNGQIIGTNANSSSPQLGAQRVACPKPAIQAPITLRPLVPAPAPARTSDPCAKYYGKGYCTDYVQQRLGRRPSGDAGTWPGNTPVAQIRAGDVAIFTLGSAGHVAVVDQVFVDKKTGNAASVRLSEMNWGKVKSDAESQRCVVTQNFGKLRTDRTVSVSSIARVWRP
jgi:surface antigen